MPGFAPLPFKKMTSPISEKAYATIAMVRLVSIRHYDNKVASHSDDEIWGLYNLFRSKGFKDHDAAEVTAMTDPNVLDTKTESEVDELVDMLKLIKGGYY